MSDTKEISLELVDADSSVQHHQQRRSEVLDNRTTKLAKEALDFEVARLMKENHQLQMRILGVNELARLLQDSSEVSEVLRERNKRLELMVIRLENRCSNFERKLKQSDPNSVGPKSTGQSPFIPGPSRQILEALMKENSELKKTLSNMSKKGASGYLEVVKATQLEEVIDQQKQDLDFLREQINSLTSSGLVSLEAKSNSSDTGMGHSLPTTMSDSGPLKRQLIKMQQAMKVKDRFCTLLSQQVANLQKTVVKQQREIASEEKSTESPSSGGVHGQESTVPEESVKAFTANEAADSAQLEKQKAELEARYEKIVSEQKESIETVRRDKMDLVGRMQETEEKLKEVQTGRDALSKRCEDLQTYNTMLRTEKSELKRDLEQFKQTDSGAHNAPPATPSSSQVKTLEDQILTLETSLEEHITSHALELEKKEKDLTGLNMMLEDAQYKQVIAQSENSTLKNQLSQKNQEIEDLQEKVRDLDEDVRGLNSVNSQLEGFSREQNYKVQQLQEAVKKFEYHYRFGLAARGSAQQPMFNLQTREMQAREMAREKPNLIVPPHTQGLIMAMDGSGGQHRSQYTGLHGQERFSAQVIPSPAMEGLQARGLSSDPLAQQQKPSTLPINLDQHYAGPQFGGKTGSSTVGGGGSNLGQQTPVTPLAQQQTSRADMSSHGSNSPPTGHIYTTSNTGGPKVHLTPGTQTPTQHRAYTTSHIPSQTPTTSWGGRNAPYQGASPTHGHYSSGGTPYMHSSVDPRFGYQYGSGGSSSSSSGYNPSVSAGTPVYVPAGGQKLMSPQGRADSGYTSLGGGSGNFSTQGGQNFSSQGGSLLGPQSSGRPYYYGSSPNEGRSPSPNDPYYHPPSSHQ